MKLYHYIPKNSDLQHGILSVSELPDELLKYAKRAGSDNPDEIKVWLEKTFPGRSRAIPVLTEPVRWQKNDSMLKEWVDQKDLIEIDFDALLVDDLIEAIYCKTSSDCGGVNEKFYKISFNEIDFSSLPWHLCSKEKGLFFGAICHYFLVLKDGYIPPRYIKKVI